MNWQKSIEPVMKKLEQAPWEDQEFYRVFVSQLYYFVKFSTRMLAAAAAVTDEAPYYERLIAHIKEESGHEKLALSDLKHAGGDIADYPELGLTRALWEPQFFKIQKHPTALLGYVLALELVAAKAYPALLPRLKELYGGKAVNFVRVHAEDDPDHVDKAIAQIESMAGEERREVEKNYEQTCAVLGHLMTEMVSAAQLRGRSNPVQIRKGKLAA